MHSPTTKGEDMPPVTGSFITADHIHIHTVAWLPAGTPRALVFIVHGYAEHILRYNHVAEALLQDGYAVYGMDHRGHGRSQGLRAYFPTFDLAVDDYRQYVEQVKAQHPRTKHFLFGHSMGSVIALAYTLRYQREMTGLALSGTAITADETQPAFVIALAQFLSRIIPTVPLFPGLGSAELSTDLSVGQAYDADPLVYRGAWRVGVAVGIVQASQAIRARLGELTLPLLIQHGEADKITPISGSRLVHEQAASGQKRLITYPTMRHEIMNEREKEQPINALRQWLNNY
jgi:alpha-beta hydrolase superfamily lysophospholipase